MAGRWAAVAERLREAYESMRVWEYGCVRACGKTLPSTLSTGVARRRDAPEYRLQPEAVQGLQVHKRRYLSGQLFGKCDGNLMMWLARRLPIQNDSGGYR